MSEHNTSSKGQIDRTGEIMTREKLVPLFDDIKSLIVSTAKGTEAVLRKEIKRVEDGLHVTQKALKATKDELHAEIKATEGRLRGEIRGTETRLRGEIKVTENNLRSELTAEIKSTEKRLSGKIDSIHVRVDNHETRIASIEGARP